MKLVLASGSQSRKALLTAAGVPFIADPADLDEDALMAELKGAAAETVHALGQVIGPSYGKASTDLQVSSAAGSRMALPESGCARRGEQDQS